MRKATVAFRSKPISRSQQLKTAQWKPTGPFRFFDLPPEIRHQVLKALVQDLTTAHADVLNLFLTCARLYSETASLFYYEVVLNTTRSMGKPDPFLIGSTTRITPRRHVRTLTIQFYLQEHMHLFYSRYGPALRDMAQQGTLQRLELEIHSCFPSADFWGGGGSDGDASAQVFELVGKRKGKELLAPRFVAEPPFQSFLKFLKDADVPQLRLRVDAYDHHQIWCRFHRQHTSGNKCEGEWKGKARMLKVDLKQVIQTFRGARLLNHTAHEVEEIVHTRG
jgi:hypothetical protein